jgi:hypothetical protein
MKKILLLLLITLAINSEKIRDKVNILDKGSLSLSEQSLLSTTTHEHEQSLLTSQKD